jgi:hypothetical protein
VANATAAPQIDTLGLQTPPPPAPATNTSTVNATATSTSASPVATASQLPTLVGQTSFNGYTYQTTATYVSGLLSNTSDGINHYITVEYVSSPLFHEPSHFEIPYDTNIGCHRLCRKVVRQLMVLWPSSKSISSLDHRSAPNFSPHFCVLARIYLT